MHTIKEMSSILGLSVNQIRARIKVFEASEVDFKSYTKRESNNRLLVDSNGLELLRRVRELEQTGKTVREAVEQIQHEAKPATTSKQSEDAEATVRPQQPSKPSSWWRRLFSRERGDGAGVANIFSRLRRG
ncbi:MAG: hypothetical protein ACE5JP_17080 [Candidatus Bipolaricaulia bacterium]